MSQPLPIDHLIPRIVATLRESRDLVIEAAPGAGKTTRVPPALLQLGGEVLILEPRRIAALMAARRLAEEMGERPGETVRGIGGNNLLTSLRKTGHNLYNFATRFSFDAYTLMLRSFSRTFSGFRY